MTTPSKERKVQREKTWECERLRFDETFFEYGPVRPGGGSEPKVVHIGTVWPSLTGFPGEVPGEMVVLGEGPSEEMLSRIDKLDSDVESIMQELSSCREAIERLAEELDERPIVKGTSLFDIDQDLRVGEPIPIVIEEYEEEVIAAFPEVEVYGTGNSEAEAIIHLKAEIRDLYYELVGAPREELGKLPLSWLRVLERLIRPSGEA